MSKTKMFISGPVSGIPDYKERFAVAERIVIANGYKAINPATHPDCHAIIVAGKSPEQEWIDCLRVCLRELCRCSHICVLDGWQNSSGALLEHQVALGLRLNCYTIRDDRLLPLF